MLSQGESSDSSADTGSESDDGKVLTKSLRKLAKETADVASGDKAAPVPQANWETRQVGLCMRIYLGEL